MPKIKRFVARRWLAITLVVLILLAASVAASLYLGYLASMPFPFIGELEDASSIRRLLVIAPHCDDEVIGGGGLIHEVLRQGGQVRVVLVTNGDGSLTGTMAEFRKLYPTAADYIRSGALRQQESLNALGALGLSPNEVFFLGYPDRGIARLWEDFWDEPYRSPYTQTDRSPQKRVYNPNSVYSGRSLLSDLRAILDEFRPDAVLFPHPGDSHPDHWAAGAFVALALTMWEADPPPRELTYLVHRATFPVPRGYLPSAPLFPPLQLVNPSSAWSKLPLEEESIALKGEAMELYKSQLPLSGSFLRSFVRSNELFCEFAYTPVPRLAEGQPVAADPTQWQTADGSEVTPLMEDACRDTLTRSVDAGADFLALYAAQAGEELWLVAEVRGRVRTPLTYTCFVRATDGQEVYSARALHPAKVRGQPPTHREGPFVLARFNLADLGYPKAVVALFKVHYPVGRNGLDRLGWALVRLP